MLRRSFYALAAVMAMASSAWAQDPDTLNIGFISTESSTNLKQAWQPLIDDLSKALDKPVKPFFASDYAGIIEGMRFNKVHLGWFGNKSAMEAVDRAQGEVSRLSSIRTATRAIGRCCWSTKTAICVRSMM